MQQLLHSIMTSVATFLMVLLVQSTLSYLTAPTGWLVVGPRIAIDDASYDIVDVYNSSDNTIDGLRIVFPIGVELQRLITSSPLSISAISTTDGRSIVELSSFPPNELTRILLPVGLNQTNNNIKVLNFAEKGLKQESSEGLESATRKEIFAIVSNAIVYAIIVGVAVYFGEWRRKALLEELKRGRKDSEVLQNDVDRTRKELSDLHSSHSKVNILLLSRMRDYAKELEFWRNAVRKLLLENRRDPKDAEQILNAVTTNLKTFGTLKREPDFEYVKTLAGYIADAEKRGGNSRRGEVASGPESPPVE